MAKKFPAISNSSPLNSQPQNVSASAVSQPSKPLTAANLADAPWFRQRATQTVFDVLEGAGYEARVVGGAVRNTLLDAPVTDVDFATTATPDDVMRAARGAGLKAVATGFDHGTVTLVVESIPFEVTTLRRDIETDGRHARVAFTTDWSEDAARRDFTINALYCDRAGTVVDPVGGLADIAQRRVRFIGDPNHRIQEDYLRILRFFRFTACYANGEPDRHGLASCRKLRDGLDHLAGERIAAELSKLLIAPHAAEVIDAMEEHNILARLFQPTCHVRRFAFVASIDEALNRTPDPVQRLGALAVSSTRDALWLRDRLKLSARAFDRLARLGDAQSGPRPDHAPSRARAYLYRHGAETYRDHAILEWARAGAPPDDRNWRTVLDLPEHWHPPEFPFSGSDVLALGVPAGPRVGKILSDVETWWIQSDFTDDHAALQAKLAQACRVTKS